MEKIFTDFVHNSMPRPSRPLYSPASGRVHQSVGIEPMRTWDSSIRAK